MTAIDHPPHYGGEKNPREAIRVIESLGLGWGFCIGNVLKYVMRAGRKETDLLEDLGKAQWYLRRAAALVRAGYRTGEGADLPDQDEESLNVLLVPLSSEEYPTGYSQPRAREFLEGLELVGAGSLPTWKDPPTGRLWQGTIDPSPLFLRSTPFSVPIVLLREVPPPPPSQGGSDAPSSR